MAAQRAHSRFVDLSRIARWIVSRDLRVLLAALAVAGGLWGFVELADEVREGETRRIDERIVRAMRAPDDPADPIGPRWLEEMGRDITALGGVGVLSVVTMVVVRFLWLQRQWAALTLVLVSTLGGWGLSSVLKEFFARPRPDLVPHLSYVSTHSFPSGHSMLSTIVYLTLATILTPLVSRIRLKVYLIGVAIFLSVLVGVSRVYLGVHYPSDVLAGWSAGLAWAVLCWLAARYLQRRGAIEQSSPTTAQPEAQSACAPEASAPTRLP